MSQVRSNSRKIVSCRSVLVITAETRKQSQTKGDVEPQYNLSRDSALSTGSLEPGMTLQSCFKPLYWGSPNPRPRTGGSPQPVRNQTSSKAHVSSASCPTPTSSTDPWCPKGWGPLPYILNINQHQRWVTLGSGHDLGKAVLFSSDNTHNGLVPLCFVPAAHPVWGE